MKQIITFIALAVMLSSCHQDQSEKDSFVAADMNMEYDASMIGMEGAPILEKTASVINHIQKEQVQKKIIKDGRIGLEVERLEQAKQQVDSLLKSYKGYYAQERLNNSDWETSYSLNIRVPAAHFETFVAALENGGGEVRYKEIDARDVTDQFIDLETRLENKKNYLKRYNDLLKKAGSVKDILEIEEKIRGIEEEIESTTGRLKYLNDQVDYSTLNLELIKPKDYKYREEKRGAFLKRLTFALSKGWYGFIDFVVFVFRIWPLWIIVTVILYIWKRYRSRKKLR